MVRRFVAFLVFSVLFAAPAFGVSPYFEFGGGPRPLLGIDAGIRDDDWGGVDLGTGAGTALDALNALFTFEGHIDKGYFSLRYQTPTWNGFSVAAGPSLNYRTTEITTSMVGSRKPGTNCIGCEETVSYGRFYQYGPEVGLNWRTEPTKHLYFAVDIASRFVGVGSFVRKERDYQSLDADWQSAKQEIDAWAHKQKLSQEWARLGMMKLGIKF